MTYASHVESPFEEAEETELAADLLAVNNERELDQFLGNLLRRAASAVGGALRSPMVHPLGGLIKGAVRRILPGVGRAFSGLVGRGAGGQIGHLAAGASQILGMEFEGLSAEDQEFAAAKQLVRLAGTAVAEAAANPSPEAPANAARQAVMHAIQLHAPGLGRSAQQRQDCGCGSRGTDVQANDGPWVRRGREIILLGL